MQVTSEYYAARRQAIAWLNSSRPYFQGVQILKKSGFKPVIVAKLLKWGERPHSREKLLYEIRQMIQVWANPSDPRFDNVDLDAEDSDDVIAEDVIQKILQEVDEEKNKEADENQLPPVIRKVIYEMADCYKTRDKLQKEMVLLGESNQEEVVAKRKTLAVSIRALSDRISRLAEIREVYENTGALPSNEELDKLFKANEDNEKDEDLSELNIDQLKTLLKNEQTKLTRAKCQLLYQQNTIPKDKKENPMPECPKKVKYQKKIETLTAYIERIKYRIAKIG